MEIAHSRAAVPIRLTDDRWEHITQRHPEMRWHRADVMDTIAAPDVVQRGDYGALIAARHYNQPPVANVFLVVVYREVSREDGFVISAYMARRLSQRREVVWSR
jgi:hypothetical protein